MRGPLSAARARRRVVVTCPFYDRDSGGSTTGVALRLGRRVQAEQQAQRQGHDRQNGQQSRHCHPPAEVQACTVSCGIRAAPPTPAAGAA